ncbi:Coiled-coil domain-containing protein 186 [Eumeta japonica]|uniref:Coiled-coil domain-containing protein 186 n=1 Tax=Eumeta variegata TaxID=151549 RepID=A0A4C1VHX1_EUMVA|nr:Coiled-coil domain-containing protein 186 [Eumeta japonica]
MSNGNVLNDIFDDHRNDNLAKENVDCDVKTSVDDILKIEVEGSDDGKSDSSEVFCKEIVLLKRRIHHQAEELQIKDHTLKDLEGKLELMHRNLEQVKKEKDTAVMRYASVECSAIEARKIADTAAKAQKTAAAGVALAENKLKLAQAERRRVCQMYDDKCHELSTSERDLAKTREELKELEGRLKWTQSKLRLEADAYKKNFDKETIVIEVAISENSSESECVNIRSTTLALSNTMRAQTRPPCIQGSHAASAGSQYLANPSRVRSSARG